jgi:hypothetical protein
MAALLDLVLDIVLSPALWMCVLFGLVYAVLFTLWRGGGFGQMLRDIVAGVAGFGLGQILATVVRVPSPRVGEVHLLWGSLFCVLFLLAGRRYWRPRRTSRVQAGGMGAGTSSGGASAP